jgi:hypothetical protein
MDILGLRLESIQVSLLACGSEDHSVPRDVSGSWWCVSTFDEVESKVIYIGQEEI